MDQNQPITTYRRDLMDPLKKASVFRGSIRVSDRVKNNVQSTPVNSNLKRTQSADAHAHFISFLSWSG